MQLDRSQIEQHILHRYENLLLDSITTSSSAGTAAGDLSLMISRGDDMNRDFFLKRKSNTSDTLLVPHHHRVSRKMASR